MRRIFPIPAVELDTADSLVAAYAYPAGRWVRANMISSIDGAAQGINGRSGSLGTDGDRRVFALLRGLADVVFVGAGTVRTEGYGPVDYVPEYADVRRAEGRPPTCPIAVVSRRLDLDPSAPLFADADPRSIVVTVESSPAKRRAELSRVADVIVAGATSIDARLVLDRLAERGLTRVVCEGGPHLLADMIRADAVDELCLTISPQMVGGDAMRILDTSSLPAGPVAWRLASIIQDGSALLTRWTRDSNEPAS